MGIFEAEVLGSELTVVEFRAPWCEASRLLSRSIARLAETHGHRIGSFRVNTEENPETVTRCSVPQHPRRRGVSGRHDRETGFRLRIVWKPALDA